MIDGIDKTPASIFHSPGEGYSNVRLVSGVTSFASISLADLIRGTMRIDLRCYVACRASLNGS